MIRNLKEIYRKLEDDEAVQALMHQDERYWWGIIQGRNMRNRLDQDLGELESLVSVVEDGETDEEVFQVEYTRIMAHYGKGVERYEWPSFDQREAQIDHSHYYKIAQERGDIQYMEVVPQDGFTVGSDSHKYPKLMIAYGSKESPAALQQRLQEWYERHSGTFPQELPGRIDPPGGGVYGDQLPLDKPRAKSPESPDITSGSGLPIPEGCSSMDAVCVHDGQPDTGDV